MDLQEAAALMVQHRVRRLPVVAGGGELEGIVMTADVIEGALPDFYFHERG